MSEIERKWRQELFNSSSNYLITGSATKEEDSCVHVNRRNVEIISTLERFLSEAHQSG